MNDVNSPRNRQRALATRREPGPLVTTGDMIVGITGDQVRYFSVEKSHVRRIMAYVVTADAGNITTIHIARAATMDQGNTAATTIDDVIVATANNVKGNTTFLDLDPTSGDLEAGEELIFTMISGGGTSELHKVYVVYEPGYEIPANQPGGRMTATT